MKYIIFLCLTTTICSVVHAQNPTVIPASTTIEAFSALTPGQYRFIDSAKSLMVDMSKDSLICAPCPAPIVCPPVVVCPPAVVCPPVIPQRIWAGMTINTKTGTVIVTYSDSTTSTHNLKNTIFIQ